MNPPDEFVAALALLVVMLRREHPTKSTKQLIQMALRQMSEERQKGKGDAGNV
jgi:hypothetical protein